MYSVLKPSSVDVKEEEATAEGSSAFK
jgi:hypothetical protein